MHESTELSIQIMSYCAGRQIDDALIALASAAAFVLENAQSQTGHDVLPIFLRMVAERAGSFQKFVAEVQKDEATIQ